TVMVGCVEGILGLRPDFNGITISPSIPSDWKEFTMEKDFRGKHLSITVKNENGNQAGVKRLTLNGREMPRAYIPTFELSDKNDIIVEL
ncbi:MAG: N,N'-diacetylchitobiose phosphorylase, partial [Lachnospiraceae bacterium]|nr:N,N'-diacetylchitobiose phosphorylase [Lachnospiraceae bacterium]